MTREDGDAMIFSEGEGEDGDSLGAFLESLNYIDGVDDDDDDHDDDYDDAEEERTCTGVKSAGVGTTKQSIESLAEPSADAQSRRDRELELRVDIG